jgi:hypothetical protein
MIVLIAIMLVFTRGWSSVRMAGECHREDLAAQFSVELFDLVFEGCQSTSDGGAVYVWNDLSVFAMSRCVFLFCHSIQNGGCLYFRGSSVGVFGFQGAN